MAKQKVALECLSYHATASQDQTEKLAQDVIAEAEAYNLYSFTFTGKCMACSQPSECSMIMNPA